MKRFESGKMTQKGQLTFPSDLRELWNLSEGDKLIFSLDDDGHVTVEPKVKKSIKNIVGILKTELKYDDEKIKQSLNEKFSDRVSKEEY